MSQHCYRQATRFRQGKKRTRGRIVDLIIGEAVRKLFPKLAIGIVQGQIDEPRPNLSEEILSMKESALQALSLRFAAPEELAEHAHIRAWRDAYQKFGVKAKEYRPTHEALARRLIKQGMWPTINPIVDIYLTNQIEHLLPHGGYDTEQLRGSLILDVCQQAELFHPLGGGEEMTNPGEIVYRDQARILTRRWNHRDCETTKITEGTQSFLLLIESPGESISAQTIDQAAIDLQARFERCFQGTFRVLSQSA
jgi:DNA/RNA-binding domain of Phe-tRNA-synthetase-like protein